MDTSAIPENPKWETSPKSRFAMNLDELYKEPKYYDEQQLAIRERVKERRNKKSAEEEQKLFETRRELIDSYGIKRGVNTKNIDAIREYLMKILGTTTLRRNVRKLTQEELRTIEDFIRKSNIAGSMPGRIV